MLSEKKWEKPQVLMLGALVLLSLVGGLLLAGGASLLLKPYLGPNQITLVALVCSVLGFQGTALVWVHFFLSAHQVGWKEAFGFHHSWGRSLLVALLALPFVLLGVFALGAASTWALNLLHEHLHWAWLKPEQQVAVKLLQNQWPLHLILVQALVAIVVAPVAEEVLFRGILYTTIRQHGRRGLALFLTAFLFALVHLHPVGFLSLFFLALALAAVYEWTRNLLASILVHAFFNTVTFLLIIVEPKWAEPLFKQ